MRPFLDSEDPHLQIAAKQICENLQSLHGQKGIAELTAAVGVELFTTFTSHSKISLEILADNSDRDVNKHRPAPNDGYEFKLIHHNAHFYLAIDKKVPDVGFGSSLGIKAPAAAGPKPATLFSAQNTSKTQGPSIDPFLKALDGELSKLSLNDLNWFVASCNRGVLDRCVFNLMAAYKKSIFLV